MATMTNPIPLATAVIAIVPVGALFFFAYGRYDGLFRDNVVFLFFMGGLLAGGFLSLFAVYMALFVPILLVTLVPVLYAIVPASFVNRRKWQGERHSVFNGGAMGLGIATMTSFAFTFRALSGGLDPAVAAAWTAGSIGLAGAGYAMGVLIGAAVADRRVFRGVLLAALVMLATFAPLSEYQLSRHPFWIGALALVGIAAFGFTFVRVMPRGVESGARRRARRRGTREA